MVECHKGKHKNYIILTFVSFCNIKNRSRLSRLVILYQKSHRFFAIEITCFFFLNVDDKVL